MSINIDSIDLKDRVILFVGKVDEDNIKAAIDKIIQINITDEKWFEDLQSLTPRHKIDRDKVIPPIRIILSTFGGSVYDGLGLYDTIRNSKTPVVVECIGKIMSMGIIVTLAANTRKSFPNTTFMIHSVSSISIGQLKEMEENVDETRRLNDILFDIIVERTNIKRDELDHMYEHKQDWFMPAAEALTRGVIKEIL